MKSFSIARIEPPSCKKVQGLYRDDAANEPALPSGLNLRQSKYTTFLNRMRIKSLINYRRIAIPASRLRIAFSEAIVTPFLSAASAKGDAHGGVVASRDFHSRFDGYFDDGSAVFRPDGKTEDRRDRTQTGKSHWLRAGASFCEKRRNIGVRQS